MQNGSRAEGAGTTADPVNLVDCEVCGGTGVMTARSTKTPPHSPPTLIACPGCGGDGSALSRPARPALRAVSG